MKTFIVLFLISQSAFAHIAGFNCRKWVITQKVLGTLTDMVEQDETNCAERMSVLEEEGKSVPALIKCNAGDIKKDSYNACYYPKKVIDGILEDVDAVSYQKICEKYRPQLETARKECRQKKP